MKSKQVKERVKELFARLLTCPKILLIAFRTNCPVVKNSVLPSPGLLPQTRP
jgi:hypothetical protein